MATLYSYNNPNLLLALKFERSSGIRCGLFRGMDLELNRTTESDSKKD